eukprot:COSAG01_NODE_2076_length_8486_cov_41.323000_5_plen_88_part_00
MSRAFPSCTWSIPAEIYLRHACSYHEIEDGHARAGELPTSESPLGWGYSVTGGRMRRTENDPSPKKKEWYVRLPELRLGLKRGLIWS